MEGRVGQEPGGEEGVSSGITGSRATARKSERLRDGACGLEQDMTDSGTDKGREEQQDQPRCPAARCVGRAKRY